LLAWACNIKPLIANSKTVFIFITLNIIVQ
jgi:hypothetical protein